MSQTANADTRTAEVREILDSYFRLTGSLLGKDIPYLAADIAFLTGRWVGKQLDQMASDLRAEAPRQQSTTWDSLRHAAGMVELRAAEYRPGTR